MATTIVTKNSSTASAVPTAAQLVQGELAVNVADKRIYTENNAGAVVELGTNPSTIDINSGTIDGTTIGASSASTGAFTTLSASGEITANGGIALGDNDKATFGAGDDLQIYHDGSNSYVQDAGDGALILNTTNGGGVYVYSAGETMATFNSNGAVNLYYDNAAKLSTTATGIDVTGNLQATGYLAVDGASGNTGAGTDRWIGGDGTAGTWFYNVPTGSSHYFAVNNTNKLAINSTGIDVTGTATMDGLTVDGTTATIQDDSANLRFENSAGTRTGYIQNRADAFEIWDDQATPMTFGTSNAERLRIDSSGNVGIGTSSPLVGLHVEKDQGSGYIAAFRSNNSSPYITVQTTGSITQLQGINSSFTAVNDFAMQTSGGNVGIGTNAPSTRLHVNTGSAGYGITVAASSQTSGTYQIGIDSNSALAIYDTAATAQRLVLSNSGNVGIGISTPSGKLHVQSASSGGTASGNADELILEGSGNTGLTILSGATSLGNLFFADSGDAADGYINYDQSGRSMRFGTATTEAMRIDASGNLLVGTTTAKGKQHVARTTTGEIARFSTPNATEGSIIVGRPDSDTEGLTLKYNSSTGDCTFGSVNTGHPLLFKSGTAERMRIDSSGNLLVGTTSSTGHKIASVATGSDRNLLMQCANGGVNGITLNTSGTADYTAFLFTTDGGNTQRGSIVVGASSTAYNTSSDQRLKENITDANDAGSKIDAIKVRQYDWKADGSHQDYGMIAQELQAVAPEAVSGDADSEEMMGVDYSKLVPMLIKEIQSLRNRVAQLEA